MAAAVVGSQWNALAFVASSSSTFKPSSNEPLVVEVAQAKSITSVKSVRPVGGASTKPIPSVKSVSPGGGATAKSTISVKSVRPVGASTKPIPSVKSLRPSGGPSAKSCISVKSVSSVGGATTTTRAAAAAVASVAVTTAATAAAAPVGVVASSQQSSAKINRSNRRSRFGEPLPTTDCDDDDELCDAVSADFHLLEMGFLEDDLGGRKVHRKGKRTRAGAKRGASMASSQVITQVPKGGQIPSRKQQVKSDGLNGTRIKSGPAGIRVKSARSRSSVDDTLTGGGDMFLSDAAWEEQAYQIIRQQKLRDAARAETKEKINVATPKILAKSQTSEAVVKITASASRKHGNLLPVDASGKDGGGVSSMSKELGLEDKCEVLLAYLHSLGVREREFIRIVDKHKTCLQANVNVVKERVEFLLSVGVQFQHLPKLIVRHPQVIEYRVEQAMKPRVQYLKSLGLDESKIGKIITISPSLLECSLERSIKPRLAYLVKNVGIKSEDIGKIVTRSPQILTQSIEDSLEPRVDFYLNELKLSKEVLAKMVTRHPQLLHYSMKDGVRPRVKYLRSLGMTDDDVIKVLSRLTQILSLSVENCLRPKYNYLVKELNGGVHTVTSFPAYFSLSLDQRIIPRHRYSEFLKRTPEGPFPMRLLTISDIAFCQWAKSSMDEYEKFRHDLLLSTFAKKFERKNKVQI